MYQPTLSRKFKLRRFHMEIDRKNGAVLVWKILNFKKITSFFQNHFSLKMLFIKYISPTEHVLYVQYMYCMYSTCIVGEMYLINNIFEEKWFGKNDVIFWKYIIFQIAPTPCSREWRCFCGQLPCGNVSIWIFLIKSADTFRF